MVVGFGALTAYLWELAEYQTFVLKIEEVGIYRDTIKDIGSGIAGACAAATIFLVTNRPLPIESSTGAPDQSDVATPGAIVHRPGL